MESIKTMKINGRSYIDITPNEIYINGINCEYLFKNYQVKPRHQKIFLSVNYVDNNIVNASSEYTTGIGFIIKPSSNNNGHLNIIGNTLDKELNININHQLTQDNTNEYRMVSEDEVKNFYNNLLNYESEENWNNYCEVFSEIFKIIPLRENIEELTNYSNNCAKLTHK